MVAEPCSQFIQLKVREVQMAEEALVQGVRVLANTGQPASNSGLTVGEDTFGRRRIHPFGECREHHGDMVRGGFQTVQRRVASGNERGVTGLAAKRLDALGMPMLAIAKKTHECEHR